MNNIHLLIEIAHSRSFISM